MSDSLTPLIDAYRAEKDPRSIDTSALRTRIVQTAARRRFVPTFVPLRPAKWLVPIAAAFIATGALAAVPGVRASVQHAVARLAVLVGAVPALGSGVPALHAGVPASAPGNSRLGASHPGAAVSPTPSPAGLDAPAPTLSPSPDLPQPPLGTPNTVPDRAGLPATPEGSLSVSPSGGVARNETASGFASAPAAGVATAHDVASGHRAASGDGTASGHPAAPVSAPSGSGVASGHGAALASGFTPSGSGSGSASAPSGSASASFGSGPDSGSASTSASVAEIPPPPAPRGSAFTPDLAAYTAAHHLHFELADYARALAAWNDYLARYPGGTFAPEARLNRAVCLAHVGRTAEARAQLSAIAAGKYGTYGRKQAERLLQALPGER